ncbi:Hypothetical predicted protein, partial [Olea europaea subsp. europaea]
PLHPTIIVANAVAATNITTMTSNPRPPPPPSSQIYLHDPKYIKIKFIFFDHPHQIHNHHQYHQHNQHLKSTTTQNIPKSNLSTSTPNAEVKTWQAMAKEQEVKTKVLQVGYEGIEVKSLSPLRGIARGIGFK